MSFPSLGASMADWACYYATEHGFKVFPVRQGTKQPRIQGWPEKATDDEEQIEWWWGTCKDDNIGIVTGKTSGLVVLDIDVKNGAKGAQTLADLEAIYGVLPDDARVTTPSNGTHYYFRYPEDEDISSCVGLAPGVDLSSDGRFVVAPPSGLGSWRYTWWPFLMDIELPELPRWLIHLRRHLAENQRAPGFQGTLAHIDLKEVQAEGTRNQACFKLACKLRGRGKDFEDILMEVQSYNEAFCEPMLDEGEIEGLVRSACTYEPNAPKGVALPEPEQMRQLLKVQVQDAEPPRIFDGIKRWFTPMSELHSEDFPPIEWIIPDLIAPGLTILSGHSKVGKSWFCLQASRAIGDGSQILGRVAAKHRVIYMALEDPERRVVKRRDLQGWSQESKDNVAIIVSRDFYTEVKTLANIETQELLRQQIELWGAKVVFIDTFSRAFPDVKQNEVESVTNALAPLQVLCQELDIAIVLVDHQRKGASDESDHIQDVGGSRAKTGIADCTLSLSRERREENKGKLKATGREGPDKVIPVTLNGSSGLWECTAPIDQLNAEERIIVEYINAHNNRTFQEVLGHYVERKKEERARDGLKPDRITTANAEKSLRKKVNKLVDNKVLIKGCKGARFYYETAPNYK